MSEDKLERCPKCGSHKLFCAVNATVYQDENGEWHLDDYWTPIDDNDQCSCGDCDWFGDI